MSSSSELQTVLVECDSSEGMFDSECAIGIDTADGRISLFADRGLVSDQGGHSLLRTYAAVFPGSQGSWQVLLPTEAFETGSRWIRVDGRKIRSLR